MVIEVTDASFAADVVERSRALPVVVDFWATWCGPCRVLGPVLERAVDAHAADVVLAKLDVDANPASAARFGIRGIPAVKAFRDGRIVAEFVGALGAAEVERFVKGLVPAPADRLVAAGAEAGLRRAVELDPGHVGARVALGRLLLRRGAAAEAETVVRPVEHDPAAAGLLARIRLAGAAATEPEESPAARAVAALGRNDLAGALPDLVETVRGRGEPLRTLARQAAVGAFAELGDDHPATVAHRPALAAAVF